MMGGQGDRSKVKTSAYPSKGKMQSIDCLLKKALLKEEHQERRNALRLSTMLLDEIEGKVGFAREVALERTLSVKIQVGAHYRQRLVVITIYLRTKYHSLSRIQ